MKIRVTRLAHGPIIGPELHSSIGTNIQGPSLIRVPDWIEDRFGAYYLYFADHKGSYIRLAYADHLAGPWRNPPGTCSSRSRVPHSSAHCFSSDEARAFRGAVSRPRHGDLA